MDTRGYIRSTDQQPARTSPNVTAQSASPSSKESFQIAAPPVSLPKGGGAIRGIGEKFAANPVTGTGSMTIPIATSPGRSGFGPHLALSYDSGSGNSIFGLGWHLSLPSITRKTDKGLPKYQDADESDVFILSGAEDLVLAFIQDSGGNWIPEPVLSRAVNGSTYDVRRYRPRIEGLFARIERWTNHADPRDSFWRSISRDNVTTWYGKTPESRLADPTDQTRIFSWLICESYDDKGNAIGYQYKEENSEGIDLTQVHEANRNVETRKANRYLKHIRYGNHTPYFPQLLDNAPWPTLPPHSQWYFEVVFDYGEHDADAPMPDGEIVPWPCRNDPFSTYRPGFEVRTYRLCRRVLMFHHFPNEDNVGTDCLVRSTDLTYSYEENPTDAQNPIFSKLMTVRQSGCKRQGGGYLKKSLPSVEFQYTEPTIDGTIHDVDPESLENLPDGLDGGNYQWIDLDGEGMSGILTEQAQGWFYKRNLSPINLVKQNGDARAEAKFAPVELVATKPNTAIGGGHAQFMDLAGDGQPDLVTLDGPTPGFYEHDDGTSWNTFRPFTSRLNRAVADPNVKLVDLDGDGHADVLVTEDEAFIWHASLAEEGFGPAQRVAWANDEERGPALVFADGTESIHLADLSGDGLTDLVRIRNGEVCYWPNLGNGRFGAKVTMDHAPWFDSPERFDQRRVHLADIDGSGVTDILYLHADGVRLYFNQSGNSWSQPTIVPAFPRTDNLTAVAVVDLLGNGTACLVWSSPSPGDVRRPMRYIDLMGGPKPHLLVRTVNNLGAETLVRYSASTKFYLQDKLDGHPWLTRLPFPVHVVERVETLDRISRNRFVTRYKYHHGFYDGVEREFRGFGMVEQLDTEELAALTESGDFPDAMNIDAASYVPTVLTKTWFHTGAYLEGARISRHFEDEYYHEGDVSEGVQGLTNQQLEAMLLPDTELPITLKRQDGTSIPWQLTGDERQEACRALKGSILRREIFALDGTDDEDRPYSATEHNYTIELFQPLANNRYAVFFAHPRESIDFHYERRLRDVAGQKVTDPRVTHAMTLEVDGFGNILKSVAIGYGRRPGLSPLQGDDRLKQEQLHVSVTEREFTNAVDEADAYRTPLPSQVRMFELLKVTPDQNQPVVTNLFRFGELLAKVNQAGDGLHDLPYEDVSGTGATADHPYRRLIHHMRSLYRRNDLSGPLALGQVESLGIPFESYKLPFTPGLLAQVFQRNGQPLLPNPSAVLSSQGSDGGGYVDLDGNGSWWIPSGRMFLSPGTADTATVELTFARQHFFVPHRYRNPFHTNVVNTESLVSYDAYNLLAVETQDALGNTTRSMNDYRLLTPRRITDPNGNRAEVACDVLGMVVGTVVMGKVTENLGDSLENFATDLDDATVTAHLQDPLINPQAILQRATTRLVYDLFAYARTKDQPNPQPAVVYTLVRETHDADLQPGQQTKIQHSFSYSDGFGREIQKKVQAEPGPVPQRDADGKIIVEVDGRPVMTPNPVSPRWVGTGWTVFNNKGKPVRQYEPFFTDTHHFEFDVRIGVSPVLFYDPVERAVATLHPNHTWEKVVFDPWRQESWDANDTVLVADPRADAEVGGFFRRLPDGEYLPTWYGQRAGGGLGALEQAAAIKAAAHAGTPSVAHADSLGRTFLTIADNAAAGQYPTRIELDIEGNQRAVLDANNRVVMRYDYDLLGTRVHQASMEAGERWMLNDVTGKPIRVWDSRDHRFRTAYDPLRRPTEIFLQEGAMPEVLIGHTVYGESRPNPEMKNQRGKVVQLLDQAGVMTTEDYDFKGNLLQSARRLAKEYKATLDWAANPALEAQVFAGSTTYDALNRPLASVSPDGSIYRPTFNEANLLEKMDVNLRGASTATRFVANIDYDAKGRRVLIEYGNGVMTEYRYDPLTFRLNDLKTTRLSDQTPMQGLSYTYDPIGNITHIQDDAQQTVYFKNSVVTPDNDYEYDAIYRLITATGREHIGQVSQPETTWDDEFRVKLQHPQNGQAMRRYTERYEYDPVGNFHRMIHQAANGNWTRRYTYNETSQLELTKKSNRLSSTIVGRANGDLPPELYPYDTHGNMLAMAHLPQMDWDFKDELLHVDLAGGGEAFYAYDAGGQRVRKVVEKNNGALIEERIYVGSFDIFRRRNGGGTVTLERETLHVMDDKQRIALVETRTQGNDGSPAQLIRYQCSNHLGSASLELDGASQVISYEEYYPYGSTSYQAIRSAVEVSPKRYRYTGMERDEETGFACHGMRYYAPWLGRWTSYDPGGLADMPSMYVYVRDNPIRFSDFSGTQSVDEVVTKIESRLKSAETALYNFEGVRSRLAQAAREYSDTLPSYLTAARNQDIATATKLGEVINRSQRTLAGAQQELKAIERALSEHANIDNLRGELEIAMDPSLNSTLTPNEWEKLHVQGMGKQLDSALEKTAESIRSAQDLLPEIRAQQQNASRLARNFKPLGYAGEELSSSGSGAYKWIGLGLAAVFAALRSKNLKEFAGNLAFDAAVSRVPVLAAVTAKDEGSALTNIVVAGYVAPAVTKYIVAPIIANPLTWAAAGAGGVAHLLFMKKDPIPYDQKQIDYALKHGSRDPFCAICHGAHGYLERSKYPNLHPIPAPVFVGRTYQLSGSSHPPFASQHW
ncbi:MAG: insecticidal toxin complex protein [Nitrospira sp.]|jgi:RHS repeat-associated protein|nr:MAG: insecticidal toxin complex protein [Nitrospira sp.]